MAKKLGMIFLLIMGLGLASCTPREDSQQKSDDDNVSRAIELMEQKSYTDAIEILVKIQNERPNPKIAMHLASAYSARAGLRVENYWTYTKGYENILKKKAGEDDSGASLIDISGFEGQAPAEVRELVKRLNSQMREFRRIERQLMQIPYIAPERRDDLERAVAVLNDHPTEGGRLYRATITIVMIRSSLEDTGVFAQAWGRTGYNMCHKTFAHLVDWVGYTVQSLMELTQDLSVAFPAKKPEYTKNYNDLRRGFDTIVDVQNLIRSQGSNLCRKR